VGPGGCLLEVGIFTHPWAPEGIPPKKPKEKKKPQISMGVCLVPSGVEPTPRRGKLRRDISKLESVCRAGTGAIMFVLNVGDVWYPSGPQSAAIHQLRASIQWFPQMQANGQFNPLLPLLPQRLLVRNPCTPRQTRAINFGALCPANTLPQNQVTCYNTGGITMKRPIWSSKTQRLQSQLTRTNEPSGPVWPDLHLVRTPSTTRTMVPAPISGQRILLPGILQVQTGPPQGLTIATNKPCSSGASTSAFGAGKATQPRYRVGHLRRFSVERPQISHVSGRRSR